jgi:hypothetical protein
MARVARIALLLALALAAAAAAPAAGAPAAAAAPAPAAAAAGFGRQLLSWLGSWLPGAAPAAPESPARRAALQVQPLSLIVGGAEAPSWRGRLDTLLGLSYFAPAVYFNDPCTAGISLCTSPDLPGLSYPYMQYLLDPTVPAAQAVPVQKVWYPAGSWSPGSAVPGGTLFYAYPYKNDALVDAPGVNPFSRAGAGLEYEVYFPADFDFKKGGKLPGLGGGAKNGRGCGGGVDPTECFSFRVMWRAGGAGEAYLYVPPRVQGKGFCGTAPSCSTNAVPCTTCDYSAGVSFLRGAFFFQKGAWNKIRLDMTLNSPANVTNGKLRLHFNDQLVISFDAMNWRMYEKIFVEGITWATWFGGSDASWAPAATTYSMFRNVRGYFHGGVELARPKLQPLAASDAFARAGEQAVRVGVDDVAEAP